MTVRPLALLLVFVLGLGVAGLTACGSSGSSRALIPASDAGALKGDFDAVARAVDAGHCDAAANAAARAQRRIDSLPQSTSVRLRRRLEEGLARLSDQAGTECKDNATKTTTVPTVTATTTTTTPTMTTTTPTTTAPPTTPTTTPPTTSTPATTTPTTTPSGTGGAATP